MELWATRSSIYWKVSLPTAEGLKLGDLWTLFQPKPFCDFLHGGGQVFSCCVYSVGKEGNLYLCAVIFVMDHWLFAGESEIRCSCVGITSIKKKYCQASLLSGPWDGMGSTLVIFLAFFCWVNQKGPAGSTKCIHMEESCNAPTLNSSYSWVLSWEISVLITWVATKANIWLLQSQGKGIFR